ncbi:MAG: hypothetical protein ACI976_002732 [Aureispira sp.]|jgi:hypothetical protein
MEAVLDVYERPYNKRYPIVNLDESPKQLIRNVRDNSIYSKGVICEYFKCEREGFADI